MDKQQLKTSEIQEVAIDLGKKPKSLIDQFHDYQLRSGVNEIVVSTAMRRGVSVIYKKASVFSSGDRRTSMPDKYAGSGF